MWPLTRHLARASSLATLVVLAISIAAGAIRLLPWLMSPFVPLAVILPFAEALAALGIETAVMLGIPMGCAFGAARFVERGEGRALLALGLSPGQLVLRAAAPVVLLSLIGLSSGLWFDKDASTPGRMARELVAGGERGCRQMEEPGSVSVPLVGVTWLCFPGHRPRVVGELPGSQGRAWYAAEELAFSADLTRVELKQARLVAQPGNGAYGLDLRVHAVSVQGMSRWGRPAQMPGASRSMLVAGFALASALLAAWLVLTMLVESRFLALCLGAAPAVLGWTLWHGADAAKRALGPGVIPLGELLILAAMVGAGALRPLDGWLGIASRGARTLRSCATLRGYVARRR